MQLLLLLLIYEYGHTCIYNTIDNSSNKSLVPLTDPHDTVPRTHCAVHGCRWPVW